jgi:chemotaxis protein MotA
MQKEINSIKSGVSMDIASIVGLGAAIVLVVISIGFSAIGNFIDLSSVMITFGGAFFCALAANSTENFIGGLKSFSLVLKKSDLNAETAMLEILDLSNVAHKEGLLSLEEMTWDLDDEFLKKGILLIVDGTDPELVRAIMETELSSMEDRHKRRIGFWEDLGASGPAWGMIGTLIGLINMLKNMGDTATIGPAMATALITTFYGSMLSNWICVPVSSKMKEKNNVEIRIREIMIEGILAIQAGESPRIVEEKLKSYMTPDNRWICSREDTEYAQEAS